MRVLSIMAASAAANDGLMAAPLKALQTQLAMVEHTVKAAGKVTPGVYETVKKMKNMVEQVIEPAIVDAHNADQELIYVTFKEIVAEDTQYRSFVDTVIAEGWKILNSTKSKWTTCGVDVEVLKSRFSECLDHRDSLVQHNNTVCCQEYAMCPHDGDCEVVKLDQAHVGCDYKSRHPEECVAHAQKLISSLKGYFQEQDERFEALHEQCTKFNAAVKAKVAECAYLQEAVNAKVAEVLQITEEINGGGQKMMNDSKQRCIDYKIGRKTKEAQYLSVAGPCEQGDYASGNGCVMNREADRRNEWESTQLIKCMLEHYCQGGKFDEELLEKCKKEIHSCHLVIDYPRVPELIPCEIPECESCPGCDECLDRPYYQYQTPCYAGPPAEGCVAVEKPECPGWC
mmetsp:Transcript_54109/g.118601  ORF Transcript_54109/g.118601 Transcript_54109/m.118601 type:complete len:399 (-) Transcript_54109:65-1261(-)